MHRILVLLIAFSATCAGCSAFANASTVGEGEVSMAGSDLGVSLPTIAALDVSRLPAHPFGSIAATQNTRQPSSGNHEARSMESLSNPFASREVRFATETAPAHLRLSSLRYRLSSDADVFADSAWPYPRSAASESTLDKTSPPQSRTVHLKNSVGPFSEPCMLVAIGGTLIFLSGLRRWFGA